MFPATAGSKGASSGQAVGERLPVHQFHDEVEVAVGLAGVEERDGVRMREGGSAAGLAHEPLTRVPLRRGSGHELDRDPSVESLIAGFVHLGRAARPEQTPELVTPGEQVHVLQPNYRRR